MKELGRESGAGKTLGSPINRRVLDVELVFAVRVLGDGWFVLEVLGALALVDVNQGKQVICVNLKLTDLTQPSGPRARLRLVLHRALSDQTFRLALQPR